MQPLTSTTIKELILLIGLSVVSALLVNFFSPRGIALIGDWDTSKGVVNAKSKNNPIQHGIEIDDIEQAKKLYDSGSVLLVDARSAHLYQKGHIKGAVSLPVDRFDEYIDSFLDAHPDASDIVVYCSGRECDQAHRLAQQLMNVGYEKCRVFIDGFEGWRNAGYPIE